MKILMLVTSHGLLGTTGVKTGFWLEELAVPYNIFVRAGAEVDIASPLGGKPPSDPKSESEQSADVKAFVADKAATTKLANTLKVAEAKPQYDAVFVAGGHGTMWDLATAPEVAALLSKTYAEGRLVASVCHGQAALVNATKKNGEPLVAGLKLTAFSDAEERAAELEGIVPFMLESRLRELGGVFTSAALWKANTVRDGQLITGQNPASSKGVAEALLAALK